MSLRRSWGNTAWPAQAAFQNQSVGSVEGRRAPRRPCRCPRPLGWRLPPTLWPPRGCQPKQYRRTRGKTEPQVLRGAGAGRSGAGPAESAGGFLPTWATSCRSLSSLLRERLSTLAPTPRGPPHQGAPLELVARVWALNTTRGLELRGVETGRFRDRRSEPLRGPGLRGRPLTAIPTPEHASARQEGAGTMPPSPGPLRIPHPHCPEATPWEKCVPQKDHQ